MNKTAKELGEIFGRFSDKRICVLGTTCCGKSTLQKNFPQAVDMDEALWPTLSKDEETYICQKPWTSEIGAFTAKLVSERVKIEPRHPLFSLILLECDLIVYLNISDELLISHCESRSASFDDARNVKSAIENSIKERAQRHSAKVIEVALTQ